MTLIVSCLLIVAFAAYLAAIFWSLRRPTAAMVMIMEETVTEVSDDEMRYLLLDRVMETGQIVTANRLPDGRVRLDYVVPRLDAFR